MMARVTMLDMHRDGLIVLPPPQGGRTGPSRSSSDRIPNRRCSRRRQLLMRSARSTCPRRARHPRGQAVERVHRRYHYLGYRTLVGAQMRYAVHDRNGWPGRHARLLHRGMEARTARQLHRVERRNYARRTSPSWSTTRGSSSCPGSPSPTWDRTSSPSSASVCPWTGPSATTPRPVLVETFVETPRYTGAVYRASGWIHVGTTQGRGRYDRQKQFDKPKKDVWLRPLRKDWKRTLNR